ncbi:MAG: TIGR03016 family PEP-CTERM system-associated outer membrane protein [Gallionellaceae bacterium]
MATVTAINPMGQGNTAIKRRLENRFTFLLVCSIAVAMLCSQQVVAADSDSASAPIQNSDSTNSDNGNAAPQQAGNRKWTITPSLGFEETYSDNIALAPRGSEKSAWVTQINPGLSLTGAGPNLKVNASYQMQNLFYSDKAIGQDTTYQQLNANANAKLIDDFFFVDGMASIAQQNISPLGTLAIDNINVTNNRTNIRTYSISPYLEHRFDDIASGELRYTHGGVDTDTAGLANSQTDNILFTLNSDTSFKTIGWGLNYNKQRISYNNNSIQFVGAAESENYSGTLRYLVTPDLTVNATAGYEKYNYLSIGPTQEGSSLTAGFSWAPSARTDIEAAAGHDSLYGPTYFLKASYRAHRTAWTLNYTENITTTQGQFLLPTTIDTSAFLNNLWASSIPDPAQRQQIVDAFISSNGLPNLLTEPVDYLTNQFFLQKLFQASFAITGKGNTIMFTIFDMSGTSVISGEALLGGNNVVYPRETGGNVLWNSQLSSRTSANISVSVFGTGAGNYLKSLTAGISRQFQPKLRGSIILRRIQQDSDQFTVGYQEDDITASLLMTF